MLSKLALALLASTALTAMCKQAAACDTLEAHGGGTAAAGTDNATAWAAIANGCLQLGPGTYNFTGNATTTLAAGEHLSVQGTGQGATILAWSATGGIVPAFTNFTNSIDVTDLTIQTSFANNPNAIGFTIVTGGRSPAFSNIDRVTFIGVSGGYWGTDVNTNGVTSVNVDSDTFYGDAIHGIGVLCKGTGPSAYSEAINVSKSNFWNVGIAVEMGSYCQAFTLTNVNSIGGVIGVLSPSTALGSLSNLVLTAVDISLQSSFAVIAQANASGGPLDVQITGGFFEAPSSSEAVNLGGSSGTVTGADIACDAGAVAGIVLGGASYMATGNTVRDCALGIFASGSNNNVQSNLYSGNTVNTTPATGVRGNTIGGGSP